MATFPKALVQDLPQSSDAIDVNARAFLWNTETLAWERSTAGDGSSTNVSVVNFPAVYPVNDNGSSLTVDTAQLPATLTGSGNLKTSIAESITLTIADGGGSITVDGTVAVSNFPAVQSVDDNGGSLTVDGTVAATQSGTWTVQPGNTQNTTAWKVTTKADQAASAPTAITVNAASISVVAANASRTGLMLLNLSAGIRTISLAFDGNAAVLNNGITLNVGDSFFMSEYDFTTGEVRAICSLAGGTLAIQEYS